VNDGLGLALEAIVLRTDVAARLAADPVRWPRRYETARDREVAAWIASALAFGRAAGFSRVLAAIFERADGRGGPADWAASFDGSDRAALAPLGWRWARGSDIADFVAATGRAVRRHGSLERAAEGQTARDALAALIDTVRAEHDGPIGRGLRALWPSPRDGSACKRGNLFLRWVVRPDDGVDLGLWTRLRPADLRMPVDTHVGRVARFVGLTRRTTDDWRTAEEITAGLRRFDPLDPVRFDFALTHLGMSGDCRGHRVAVVCARCPLDALCQAGP
jgi:uncharacterized protein (TIGR02757 family)